MADARTHRRRTTPAGDQPLAPLGGHYIELAQGCRDKTELARLKKGLAARHTEVLPLTPAISQRAAELIDALALSHSMRLADALIGATALEHDLTLLTANTKHFGAIEGLQVETFVP